MKFSTSLLLSTVFCSPVLAQEAQSLARVAAVPLGAEVTGLAVYEDNIFMNYQHPEADNAAPFNTASIGVISGANLAANPLALPKGEAKQKVTSSLGNWQLLIAAGQDGIGVINGETSDSPDFNSFIPTGENEGYLFSNWEERPGGISRAKIKKQEGGEWALEASEMLDLSSVNGTWINCFGSTSPWGTPLSSEELYFDDTADWNNAEAKDQGGVENLAAQLGHYPNPYDYGFILEIQEPTADTPTPVKHRAMGRYSHENSFVMPDQKTVYLSDDGTDVVFFKFIADEATDLSKGTLYAAKVTQNSEMGADVKDTKFDIEWIELAHGDNASIEAWAHEYDGITTDDHVKGQSNYITDEEIAAWANGEAADDRVAFLESRKAAKAKGATAEFRKMEGVAFNGTDVFLAMTQITKGMADDSGDIQLAENPCGAVFRVALDDEFNAVSMEPFVVGGPYDKANSPNSCDAENISSPDNILALADGSLLIGEDSGDHENNMLWLTK